MKVSGRVQEITLASFRSVVLRIRWQKRFFSLASAAVTSKQTGRAPWCLQWGLLPSDRLTPWCFIPLKNDAFYRSFFFLSTSGSVFSVVLIRRLGVSGEAVVSALRQRPEVLVCPHGQTFLGGKQDGNVLFAKAVASHPCISDFRRPSGSPAEKIRKINSLNREEVRSANDVKFWFFFLFFSVPQLP